MKLSTEVVSAIYLPDAEQRIRDSFKADVESLMPHHRLAPTAPRTLTRREDLESSTEETEEETNDETTEETQ